METINESIKSHAASSLIRFRSNSLSSNISNGNNCKVKVNTKNKVKQIINNNNKNNIVNILNKKNSSL